MHKQPAYKSVVSIIRNGTRIDLKAKSTHQYWEKEINLISTTVENELSIGVYEMYDKEVFINFLFLDKRKKEMNSRESKSLPASISAISSKF